MKLFQKVNDKLARQKEEIEAKERQELMIISLNSLPPLKNGGKEFKSKFIKNKEASNREKNQQML